MAITTSIWEDSGPLTAGHGTIRQEVDNLGWKASDLDETYPFADYPNGRPINSELYTLSFKKYYYFKFQGTYDDVTNVRMSLTGAVDGQAEKVRILYKWTDVYATPDNNLLAGITYDPSNPSIWTPKLSNVGPELATSYVLSPSPNTTYYSAYLVTQLYMDKSVASDYGNLGTSFKLNMTINEKKTGLPGFDSSLINWGT